MRCLTTNRRTRHVHVEGIFETCILQVHAGVTIPFRELLKRVVTLANTCNLQS